ncbi:shikimate kinase [Paenibacillus sp. Soil787]|uniref:shikimate kinase n=1 Tax=Paenibacillus sp. Soil787 TaxID=1736411 RepID=UPI00070243DA|nr:hypothetical protein ASG93_30735 [Paenibacillus sp. Soil787]
MDILKQNGQIIYLHVPYEEIKQRIINITTRGIVIKKGNSLKDVYDERVPLYNWRRYCRIYYNTKRVE